MLGGWIWADVAQRLRGAGHRVFTPTLTGVGERHHLIRPDIGLATHIADITAVIDYEDLRDVILVAHSFSGVAATGALDARRDRVRQFAFFDALRYVEKEASHDVPNALRDASRDKKGFGHGEGYLYPHAFRDHYVAERYLPDEMQGLFFYAPGTLGYEKTVAERLAYFRARDAEESIEKRVRRYAKDDAPAAPTPEPVTNDEL